MTDHPMIPREHLARWLGVSEGRVSQMMRTLVDTWSLVERRGQRGDTRYTLSAEGIRYITHRDRAQLPTTQGIWSTALTTDRQGRRRHVGHRIDTWARQTKHADGITWFLSKLEAETKEDSSSETPVGPSPTARSRPGLQLGRFGHRPRRRGATCSPAAFTWPFLPRVRASRPPPQGGHCPPEPLHKLLLVARACRRPASIPHHALRRGHGGRRGHLRAHSRPDEPDVPAHPRVLHTRSVQHRDTWPFLASALGG